MIKPLREPRNSTNVICMKRKPVNPRAATTMDVVIGRQIRAFRTSKGLSQTDLGGKIGITFQQVQKIEKGINRISASRLHRVAKALETPIAEFFAD